MHVSNDQKKPLKCSVCEEVFYSVTYLLGHIRSRHKDKEVQCPDCKKAFTKACHMKQHRDAVHLKLKPFSCTQCDARFGWKGGLKAHVINVHTSRTSRTSRTIICDYEECKAAFPSVSHLKQHKKIVHNGEKFPCDHCLRSYSSPHVLRLHINSVHLDIRPFQCTICDYRTIRRSQLLHVERQHIKSEDRKTVACDLCNYKTLTKGALNQHVKNVHEGRRDFECKLCSKQFVSGSKLRAHTNRVHIKKKSFKCMVCDYSTHYYESLNRHVKSVHGLVDKLARTERARIQCDKCDFSSAWLTSVRHHIKGVHEKDNDYCCPKCKKIFWSPKEAMKHVRSNLCSMN